LYVYFRFVTSPLSQIVSVLEKQVQGTIFQVILFTAQISGLLIGVWYDQAMASIASFSIGSAVCYFGFLTWIVYVSGNSWSIIWFSSLKAMAWTFALLSPLLLIRLFEMDHRFGLAGLFLSMVMVMARYLFLIRKAWQ